jgi:hypothetical protein
MGRKRNSPPSAEEQADRYTLIRRAILGLDYWLLGQPLLLPFCDYIKILLHRPDPLIVTVWQCSPTCRLLFSTHPDVPTKFSSEFATAIPGAERFVACYTHAGRVPIGDVAAAEVLARLFAHPEFTNSSEGKLFGHSLKSATVEPVISRRAVAGDSSATAPSMVFQSKAPFEAMFDGALRIVGQSEHFKLKEPHEINLFAFLVVANLKAETRSESRLTYSAVPAIDATRRRVEAFDKEALASFHSGALTLELNEGSRESPRNRKTHDSTSFMDWSRIYVPIHVEGAPWIVLLKSFDSSSPSAWYDVYHFYHDVIPRIGAMVRSEAKSAYFDIIERLFSEEISNPDSSTFISRFNNRSASLLNTFPFPQVCLTEASTNGDRLVLPSGKHLTVITRRNGYFQSSWTYDPMGSLGREACASAIRAFASEERRIRARFLGHRHSVVNLNPGPLLKAAMIQDASLLSGEARRFVEDAAKITDVLFAILDFVTTETRTHQPLQSASAGRILKWLKARETSGVASANLHIDENADFVFKPDSLEDVFLVLWNLWHNAGRMAEARFDVILGVSQGTRRITFSQDSEWPEEDRQWIDFLNGRAPSPNREREPSGLEIVKRCLDHLGWPITATATPYVRIEIAASNVLPP